MMASVILTPLLIKVLRDPCILRSLTIAEWDLLIRQARRANLLASLHVIAEEGGLLDHVPPVALRHLEWARVVTNKHVEAVLWEVRKIRSALSGTGIPLILLKGAAYVIDSLPASEGRLFSDVDIIVPKNKLDEVEAALMLGGWVATHHDAYDQRYYRQWMHELPPMQHMRRLTVIDVHHAILPETARLRPSPSRLMEASVSVKGDEGLRVFCPADMVLHSAVHLFHDGELEQGLRDLFDLHRLFVHFGGRAGFWETLTSRAEELDLQRPLFYALRYTLALLHTPIPAQVILAGNSGAPPAPLLFLMDQLFMRALLPSHASCTDRFSNIARHMLYVRANWLRMPPLLLVQHLLHKAFISERLQK